MRAVGTKKRLIKDAVPSKYLPVNIISKPARVEHIAFDHCYLPTLTDVGDASGEAENRCSSYAKLDTPEDTPSTSFTPSAQPGM